MIEYSNDLTNEKQYLADTMAFIHRELARQEDHLSRRRRNLLDARREMYENTVHYSNDFARMTEINQHLTELSSQTNTYGHTEKLVERLKRMMDTPYFGRFDFTETGSPDRDKIYLGISTLMDSEDYTIYVYDWRSPIASIFYRFEPGNVEYPAPDGTVSGTVTLKRQFKIRKSELLYFFDCAVQIRDEILQEALGRNASPKMRTIVETIQKEQDLIIRDTENDVLIVQGAAGSGKTSIALHRVAFLLYEGLAAKLEANNILILSPNGVFERYIAGVLPELGEEAVEQVTLEDILNRSLGQERLSDARNRQMEAMLSGREKRLTGWIAYKGSATFITVLERLLDYAEHKLLKFEDVQYAGTTLFTGNALKNEFLNNKTGASMARRLKRIESRILERVKPLYRKRLGILEELVEKSGEHEFEIRSYARLLAMKENRTFLERLRKMTEMDCAALYLKLFRDKGLFARMVQGLELPEDTDAFREYTLEALEAGHLPYEDASALAYLRLKAEGHDLFGDIRQVVIDEAQDYHPLHCAIFRELFPSARFTIIGDIHQTIGSTVDAGHYQELAKILSKPKSLQITLDRSYRSTIEITAFSQKILGSMDTTRAFERHGEEPCLFLFDSEHRLADAALTDARRALEDGHGSAVLLCRTRRQAQDLYNRMGKPDDVALVQQDDQDIGTGILILPVYLAKGLEFDAAFVIGADESYSTEQDRKLLYIACTRALHRLNLYACDTWSRLIPTAPLSLVKTVNDSMPTDLRK